jgi:26S proteasome regulatory subunit N1
LAGILAVMHSALDLKATLGGQHPHLFFLLASALRPRMLMTLDTEGKMLPVPVRVGQAVDTVAQVRFPAKPHSDVQGLNPSQKSSN